MLSGTLFMSHKESKQTKYKMDLDQDRQNVGPDLDPNCLTL